jgi:hypothetical protein
VGEGYRDEILCVNSSLGYNLGCLWGVWGVGASNNSSRRSDRALRSWSAFRYFLVCYVFHVAKFTLKGDEMSVANQYITANIWRGELDYCSVGDVLYWVEPLEDYIVSTKLRSQSLASVAGVFVDQEIVRRVLGECGTIKAMDGYEGIFVLQRNI